MPSNYRGFRSAGEALEDLKTLAASWEGLGVGVRLSPDRGPEMAGTGTLSVQVGDRDAVVLLLDDRPVITLTANQIRGGWPSINDDDDLGFSVDFTSGRLHIVDALGQAPTPLRSMQRCASHRVARQGVRGWRKVLGDIGAVGASPRERPDLPVSVVVRPEHDALSWRALRDGDTPSQVTVLVAGSEAFCLSAGAFRGAWLWDRGDETYLDIDSSGGRSGGHWLLTHQISTRRGLH